MTRQPAVIFDRDGTLFSVDGPTRSAGNHAWANFNASIRFDAPVPVVHALWHAIRPGVARIVVSGRDGEFERPMLDSMAKHGIRPDAFFQRVWGDRRQDSIVKAEILDALILPRWDVRYVIDDRPQVVAMWRERGIPVLAVTDPKIQPPITTKEHP
jgi:phosphoglycolate phosphatase-like HAD superfamily hydrolase